MDPELYLLEVEAAEALVELGRYVESDLPQRRRSARTRRPSARARESSAPELFRRILRPPDERQRFLDALVDIGLEEWEWEVAGEEMWATPAPTPPLPTREEVAYIDAPIVDMDTYTEIMGDE